jgi:hypothetical protein
MTIRFDSPLRSGTTQFGVNSLGVQGSLIPSTGTHGPSILFNNLNLPSENNDEFRVRIVTVPAGLTTWQVEEDGSILADGPDGSYSGIYEGFKNGVSYGFSTFSITIGTPAGGMLRDLNQSFGGKRLCTTPLVGIPATSVPSTGTDGPGYVYNDLVFPADTDKLVRGFITSFPNAGTLVANEDTSFTFSGAPDGSYTFTYELRLDDIVQGTATVNLDVGNPVTSFTITLGDTIFSGSATASSSPVATITITLDDIIEALAATGYAPSNASADIILDNELVAIYAVSVYSTASTACVLSDVLTSISASGSLTSTATMTLVSGDTIFNGSAGNTATVPAQITITLDDMEVNLTAFGSRPPDIVGPNARLPISLGITLDGKLIILC